MRGSNLTVNPLYGERKASTTRGPNKPDFYQLLASIPAPNQPEREALDRLEQIELSGGTEFWQLQTQLYWDTKEWQLSFDITYRIGDRIHSQGDQYRGSSGTTLLQIRNELIKQLESGPTKHKRVSLQEPLAEHELVLALKSRSKS